MQLTKKLSKHGNSRAITMEKPILELLDIDDNTVLEVSTDGESLIITPVRDEKYKEQRERAIERIAKRYRGVTEK